MSTIAIEINNLTVKYADHTAIEDINLKIDKGDYVAVVGPNGSGKTTLLKCLLGLIRPTSGEVITEGRPARHRKAEYFGYVPQLKTLDKSFPARAVDLVINGMRRSWPGRISREEREEACHALAKVGMEDECRRPISELSGGQLQKVYLARSFIRRPQILLLDEPATGIDVVCEENINKHIEEVNSSENTTIIMVTHNWATARHHANTILLLNRRQIFYGPANDAFRKDWLRQAFVHTGMEDTEEDAHV
jgi:zinc transport system ATP-binding protein